MSDASPAPGHVPFRGPVWERERARMLLVAWRLADTNVRPFIEQAIRAYVQRHPNFTRDLQYALLDQAPDVHKPQPAEPLVAQALASAWVVGDPDFRPDLEHALRQYVQEAPAFRAALRALPWMRAS
jgi:hypothetical protein